MLGPAWATHARGVAAWFEGVRHGRVCPHRHQKVGGDLSGWHTLTVMAGRVPAIFAPADEARMAVEQAWP